MTGASTSDVSSEKPSSATKSVYGDQVVYEDQVYDTCRDDKGEIGDVFQKRRSRSHRSKRD